MTKVCTASALDSEPFSTSASRPQENETEPDGKKLSPNWSIAIAEATLPITANLDPACFQQRVQTRDVVLCWPFHDDQQSARFELYAPMVITGTIPCFERCIRVARRDA